MALSLGPRDDADELDATINTTPLVDVMLVLLIIFLITIPVATQTVVVHLPREANQVNTIRPGTVTIAVTQDGTMFWNAEKAADVADIAARLAEAARMSPVPDIDIRGDAQARYALIAPIVRAIEQSGIAKVAFVTEPPRKDQ